MKTSFTCATRRVNLGLFILFVLLLALVVMAESAEEAKSAAKVYIILTDKPKSNEDPKTFHLHTLSTAVGSAQAATDALVHSYTNAATGFSAKLTTEQVTKISKLPGVHKVIPTQNYQPQDARTMFTGEYKMDFSSQKVQFYLYFKHSDMYALQSTLEKIMTKDKRSKNPRRYIVIELVYQIDKIDVVTTEMGHALAK